MHRKKGCQSLGLCPPATTWAPTSWDCSKTCVELVDVVKGIPVSNGQYLGWSSFAHGRVGNQLAVTKPRRGMARRKVCLTEKTVWEVVPTSLRVGAHIVLCFLGDLHEGRFPNFHDALEHTAHDTDGPQHLGRYRPPGKRPNIPTQSKSKASAGPRTTRQRRRRAHTQPCGKAAPAAQGQKHDHNGQGTALATWKRNTSLGVGASNESAVRQVEEYGPLP